MDEHYAAPSLEPTIAEITAQLTEYGQQEGLRGLEDRVQRGLDPAAMLAVPDTRQRLEGLAQAYGADFAEVESLVKDLHVGGVWRRADELAAGSPAAAVWIAAGEATVRDKAVLGDLTPDQFQDDMRRVTRLLDDALADPVGFGTQARANLIDRARTQYQLEDGVPVATTPEGFLAMAVTGYKSGIVADAANNLLFVGANELNFDAVGNRHALSRAVQEDRGREAAFYVDAAGERHIKELYPGFGIVLDGDLELAKDLARSTAPETATEVCD
jgi:hypothetical protein